MIDLSDPHKVHETLVNVMLMAMFPTMLVVAGYMSMLGAFFNELKTKEPEVWTSVGAPALSRMILLPFLSFKELCAVLSVLRERAAGQSGYRYAPPAYMLLYVGLGMCVALFALFALIIGWISYHGL